MVTGKVARKNIGKEISTVAKYGAKVDPDGFVWMRDIVFCSISYEQLDKVSYLELSIATIADVDCHIVGAFYLFVSNTVQHSVVIFVAKVKDTLLSILTSLRALRTKQLAHKFWVIWLHSQKLNFRKMHIYPRSRQWVMASKFQEHLLDLMIVQS